MRNWYFPHWFLSLHKTKSEVAGTGDCKRSCLFLWFYVFRISLNSDGLALIEWSDGLGFGISVMSPNHLENYLFLGMRCMRFFHDHIARACHFDILMKCASNSFAVVNVCQCIVSKDVHVPATPESIGNTCCVKFSYFVEINWKPCNAGAVFGFYYH